MPVQLFLVQCILWFVLTINQRAIAHVDYLQVIITDFLIASMNFFLVKKLPIRIMIVMAHLRGTWVAA